mmetsp:Transcript_546/g.1411  ORF Transcript_546/g.1411 Transcript_546/m.1411 type:complete len:249 (-) Transcript_546:877-1623(-)
MRNDFEQRHLVDGREVVHAHDALGHARVRGDLAERQRARVRRDDRAVAEHALEHLDHLVLHAELLEDRLHNQLAPAQPLPPVRVCICQPHDVAQLHVAGERAERAPLDLARQVRRHLRLAAREPRARRVLEHHAHTLGRAHLGNARAHQARAQHTHGGHARARRAERVLLARGLPEEEALQRRALGRDRERAEPLRLDDRALDVSALQARTHRRQDRGRRRVLPLRLLERGLLRHLEEEVAAGRRALE